MPEVQSLSHGGGNTGGGNPREKRAGSVQEVEKERGANGVSKVGSRKKTGKKTQHCIIFCNKRGEEAGDKKMRGGEGPG